MNTAPRNVVRSFSLDASARCQLQNTGRRNPSKWVSECALAQCRPQNPLQGAATNRLSPSDQVARRPRPAGPRNDVICRGDAGWRAARSSRQPRLRGELLFRSQDRDVLILANTHWNCSSRPAHRIRCCWDDRRIGRCRTQRPAPRPPPQTAPIRYSPSVSRGIRSFPA